MSINELLQVGSQIKKFRKEKGYTQKDFSKRIGIAYSTYSNYENNNRVPNAETLQKIATALDVSVSDILGTSLAQNLNADIAFYNYLESIGYEVHEADDMPKGVDWSLYIKNLQKNLYMSDMELTDFHNDIDEYVHLKILKIQMDTDNPKKG